MEEIIVVIGRGIGGLLKWIFVTALVDYFIYGCGYVLLKIITLGKYPLSNKNNQTLCLGFGLMFIVVTIALIAVFNGS